MEQVVFAQAIEGLYFKGLKGRLDPKTIERLAAIGVDLSKPLLPAYPKPTWKAAIELTAAGVFSKLGPADGQRELGQRCILGITETGIGKAMAAMARVLGPKRTLSRLTHNLRTGNNYTTTEIQQLGPTHFELSVTHFELRPEFMQGVVLALLEVSGAKAPQVQTLDWNEAAETARFDVRWEP